MACSSKILQFWLGFTQVIDRVPARLRGFCHHLDVRRLLTPVLALALAVSASGCPSSKGSTTTTTAGMPSAVQTYGALRWVPAGVSYAVVARRATDLSAILRDLADSVGILFDADATVAGEWSKQMFSYDLFSPDSLAGIGIDVEGGAVIYGTGLSPTIVARLGDPSALDAFVDRMRQNGVALQSQMSDDIEVFSIRMDEDVSIQWAAVDGWVLSRIEFLPERAPELGWLAGARGAKGALGGDPDFTAAVTAGKDHAPGLAAGEGPPIVVVLRPGRVLDAATGLGDDDEVPIEACGAPLRSVPRIVGAFGSSAAGVTGALVADLAEPSKLEALILPAPPGWSNARANAALQVDVSVDVDAAMQAMRGCFGSGLFGLKTAHVALHHFDDDGWPDKAAAYADLSTDRVLRGLLSQIPFLGRMSSGRKIGSTDVIDVSVPFFIDFTYLLTPSRMAASRGSGMMELVLGEGQSWDNELFRFEVHPQQIPDAAWHLAFEQLDLDRRATERTIQRLRAWSEGKVEARLDGGRVVVTVAGTRRK